MQKLAATFFRKLSFCIKTGQCSGELARTYYCDAAVSYGIIMLENFFIAFKIGVFGAIHDTEAYEFAVECPVLGDWGVTMSFGEEGEHNAISKFREKFMQRGALTK